MVALSGRLSVRFPVSALLSLQTKKTGETVDRRQNDKSLAIAQRLVHCAIAVSIAMLGQSHKDNVRCTAVEEQLEAKQVQLSQPSSTSLLMISSGLT